MLSHLKIVKSGDLVYLKWASREDNREACLEKIKENPLKVVFSHVYQFIVEWQMIEKNLEKRRKYENTKYLCVFKVGLKLLFVQIDTCVHTDKN